VTKNGERPVKCLTVAYYGRCCDFCAFVLFILSLSDSFHCHRYQLSRPAPDAYYRVLLIMQISQTNRMCNGGQHCKAAYGKYATIAVRTRRTPQSYIIVFGTTPIESYFGARKIVYVECFYIC